MFYLFADLFEVWLKRRLRVGSAVTSTSVLTPSYYVVLVEVNKENSVSHSQAVEKGR